MGRRRTRPIKAPARTRQRRCPLAVYDHSLLLALWASSITKDEIIETLNTTRQGVERAKADMGLPDRPARKPWHKPHLVPKGRGTKRKADDGDGPYISEEEVQHRMAKVQATWTDEMFSLRAQGRVRPVPFVFPVYSMKALLSQ